MDKKWIKYAQIYLRDYKKTYNGLIDGIIGKNTRKALNVVVSKMETNRLIVYCAQCLFKEEGIDVGALDGIIGSKTLSASQIYDAKDLEDVIQNDSNSTPIDSIWPHEKDLYSFYGNYGKNLITLKLPYPHILSWDTDKTINAFQCHEKVHDSLKHVLTQVLTAYGIDNIKKLGLDLWGGCFCIRNKKAGTNLSTHSWGIAIDYDPEHNQFKWGKDKARFATKDYDEWWSIWESAGWVSLGRKRNYDWMHIQAARF